MQILGYSSNGFGLGHLTRMSALLLAIREELQIKHAERESPLDLMLLTEADSIWPSLRFHLPMVKIPSKALLYMHVGRSEHSEKYLKCSALLARLSRAIIEEIVPDVLIVDTFLQGRYHEFADGKILSSTYVVFVNRERKPGALFSAHENILLQYVDHVIVPHLENEALVAPTRKDITDWIGPLLILDHVKPLTREDARLKLKIASAERAMLLCPGVIVTAEDRAITEHVAKTVHRICPEIRMFVLGNELDLEWAESLVYYPAIEVMPAFDVAIGAGGYNTLHELLASGVPSAFFAKERFFDDQLARIRRYVSRGACIELQDPLGGNWAEDIFRLSTDRDLRYNLSTKARQCVPRGGTRKAARCIVERLQSKTQGG